MNRMFVASCLSPSPNFRVLAAKTVEQQNLQQDKSSKPAFGLKSSYAISKARKPSSIFESAKMSVLNAITDALFKPHEEPNLYFQENFGPVEEVGSWMPVSVIEGAVPLDFPAGTYIRNGPNPYLGGANMTSPFGKCWHHWFEGDGMLHATRFEGGDRILYQNKYVETGSYKMEKRTKKRAFLNAVEGDPVALFLSFFLNLLRFGKVNRPTCNTQVIQIAGKFYAIAENDLPHEIDISDLSTRGVLDFDGQWDRPFTSHPKLDVDSDELVFFGGSPTEPYVELGIVSADGKLVHRTDLGIQRSIFLHEILITKHYNIILDFPLLLDPMKLINGGSLISLENDSYANIGVMPRYGDAKSIKWFPVEVGCCFHTVNAFEDGNEVVVHGILLKHPFILQHGMRRIDWFARAVTPVDIQDAKDPWLDGALYGRLHEWRLNLSEGTVSERDLTDLSTSGMEMPTINRRFTGRKNKYAYAQVVDVDASKAAGLPKYGKMVKIRLPSSREDGISVLYHNLGSKRFGSEPLFIPRPSGSEDDDGWIVSYVYDESTNTSEVLIVDARDFGKAVARIKMPQRVPYGFHSNYFPSR